MRLLPLVAVLALFGCSSTQTVQDVKSQINCTYPDAPQHEAPGWICDVMPEDLEIGAVGFAKNSKAGLSIMRDIAMNDAKSRLAQQFESNVNNLFKQASSAAITSTDEKTVETVNEYFESVTKNVTSQTLTNARVLASQRSPGGGLYTLVGMDKATYDQNLQQIVNHAKGKDPVLWKQFNSQKTEQALDNVLNSLDAQL